MQRHAKRPAKSSGEPFLHWWLVTHAELAKRLPDMPCLSVRQASKDFEPGSGAVHSEPFPNGPASFGFDPKAAAEISFVSPERDHDRICGPAEAAVSVVMLCSSNAGELLATERF